MDAVLRLRCVHRLRHRARRGVHRCRRPAAARAPGRTWRQPRPCRALRAGGDGEAAGCGYAKLGKVRFISHRDTARIWERALRRAGVPGRDERGVHAAAPGQLRAGAADRGRVDRRVPRRRADRRRSDRRRLELAAGPAHRRPARRVHRAARRPPRAGRGSLQEVVTSVTWELAPPAGADAGAPAADSLLSADGAPARAGAQGRASCRRRPPAHRVADDVRRRRAR